jgi:hypothetical protein
MRDRHLARSAHLNRLGCLAPKSVAEQAGDIARTGAKAKQRSEEQIGAHRTVGRLHLSDARLAGSEAFRHFRLGQPESLSAPAETFGERQLHLDEPPLVGGQAEEVTGIAYRPPSPFELPPSLSVHVRSLSYRLAAETPPSAVGSP